MKESYDVVVVGAGPAGATAARSSAESGMRVLVVERKPVVGVPVRCAELIPAPLLGELDTPHDFVVQRVRGMKTFLPDGTERTSLMPGLMIRRDLFDRALCGAAKNAGAELLLGATALSADGTRVRIRRHSGEVVDISCRVVIGADGPHSRVGAWIGSVNRHRLAALQVRAPLVRPLEYTEVYFDRGFYGGYGWLFPKGGEANVGLGLVKRAGGPASLRSVLSRFVELLSEQGKILNQPLGWTAGWIPAVPLRGVVRDRFVLAGDAAGHTHPITGAGVFQATSAGKIAGSWAAKAIRAGDMSLLAGYEQEWGDLFGESHQRGLLRRRLLEKDWENLDQVIRRCWVAFREYYMDH